MTPVDGMPDPSQTASPTKPPSRDSPEKILAAAQDFESLLLAQMLRTTREATTDDSADPAGATALEISEQQFAQMLSKSGGIGLAKLVVAGLGREGRTTMGP